VVQAGPMHLNPTTDGLELTVDLPGLEEQDVDVTVSGDMLLIRGERRTLFNTNGEIPPQIANGHEVFSRAMELP
jgi:HSP20 family protein